MPDDANALIAQGIKPPPAPDFVGPLTALSQMAHAQAQSDLERAQTAGLTQSTAFQGTKIGALQNYQSRLSAGESPESAIVSSGYSALDPVAADAALKNVQQQREITAIKGGDPNRPASYAPGGPELVSKAATALQTQAATRETDLKVKQGQAILVGQLGNMIVADPSPAGRQRVSAMAHALGPQLGISTDMIDRAMALPDDKWAQLGDQLVASGQTAEAYARTSGREKAAELRYTPQRAGVNENIIYSPEAAAIITGRPIPTLAQPGAGTVTAPVVPAAPAASAGAPPDTAAAGAARPPIFTQVPPGAAVPGAVRAPVAPAPSPYSGGRLPTFATQPGSGTDLSANMIRHFEGFLSTPRWDKTAYRAGFGSDTKTNPDGSVEPIRPGMYISPADAERDLQRRITQEFQPRVQQQIGGDTWNRLSPQAQASLTSVAYNYGKLPSPVASAARTGNPDAIARAIASLPTNQNRRLQEANYINGGFAVPGGVTTVPFGGQTLQMPRGTSGLPPAPGIPGPDTTASWLLAAKAGGIPAPVAPPLPAPQPVQRGTEPPVPAGGTAPAAAPAAPAPAAAPATPAAAAAPGAGAIPTIENPTGAAVPRTGLAADQAGPLLAPRPGGGMVLQGPTSEDVKRLEHYGNLPDEYRKEADSAKVQSRIIDNAMAAMQGWEPGRFAEWKQTGREFLQNLYASIGMPNKNLDVATGNYQAFVKDFGQLVREAVEEASPRGGIQVSKLYGTQFPNPLMDKYGIQLISEQFKGLNDFKLAQQQAALAWSEARQRQSGKATQGPAPGTGGMDFPAFWNKHSSIDAFTMLRMFRDNPAMAQDIANDMAKTPEGLKTLKNIAAGKAWIKENNLLQTESP